MNCMNTAVGVRVRRDKSFSFLAFETCHYNHGKYLNGKNHLVNEMKLIFFAVTVNLITIYLITLYFINPIVYLSHISRFIFLQSIVAFFLGARYAFILSMSLFDRRVITPGVAAWIGRHYCRVRRGGGET